MKARARRLRRHRRASRRYVPRLRLLMEPYLAAAAESAAQWQAYFDKLHDEMMRTLARMWGVSFVELAP